MKNVLLNFTKSVSSGISLLENEIKNVLPGLYVINRNEDEDLDLIFSLDYPSYYPQAYGEYLDRLGYQFRVDRQSGEDDESYRRRILYSITRSVTLKGLRNSIKTLFEVDNIPVNVNIIETYKNAFDGTSTSFDTPIRVHKGTRLYGISIIITPKNLKQTTMNVSDPTGYEIVLDEDGNPITTPSGLTKVYIKNSLGEVVEFNKYQNIYYKKYLNAFSASSLRDIVTELTAAGIKVEKVTIRQPGAGGNKGEIYVN